MGPVIVGLAAIAVSALFNFLALRRSGQNLALAEAVAERTEERYQSDQVEARKKQLLDALLDVFREVNAWVLTNAQYSARLRGLATAVVEQAPKQAVSEAAAAVQNHDMEKQRPALGEAHRALQVAKLLITDIAGVLPTENLVLIDAQLSFIARVLADAQNLVHGVSAEQPERIGSSINRFEQSRRQVSASISYLLTLVETLVLGNQDAVHELRRFEPIEKPPPPHVPEN